jgi:hypothetical protein
MLPVQAKAGTITLLGRSFPRLALAFSWEGIMDALCNQPGDLFEDALKGSLDAILIARHSDRRILAANWAATCTYGLSRSELLGLTV